MTPQERALDAIERYWRTVADRDVEATALVLADDVVRSGPYRTTADTVHGKRAYCDFMRVIQGRMTEYRNQVSDILVSADGRRAYGTCTEWLTLGGTAFEFPLAVRFELTDAGLISAVDIYWKSPGEDAAVAVRADRNRR